MKPIEYIDRVTGEKHLEHVYGGAFLQFLYGDSFLSKLFGRPFAFLVASIPLFSKFYGWLQTRKCSAKKIAPFIQKYHVDTSEFAPVSSFQSFNDFFTRKLNPGARPIAPGKDIAVIPADGRYLFIPNLKKDQSFVVKGKTFNLSKLLRNEALAQEYAEGSMVIARLCPTDYHRYHFPCDCIAGETKEIGGKLYSVNPIAIKKHLEIYWENKRTLCELKSDTFGKVQFLEIGATFVGSIHQTYQAHQYCKKGEEKGYFSFGGSCLILLFPKDSIEFDADLVEASRQGIEVKCLMGQILSRS